MLAIATSSTSTHAHARPKTRVGGFEQRRAPRIRARAASSRETRWGNSAEVRRSTAGLSQYLSPEPLLSDPEWCFEQHESGRTTPTYSYAYNNPVRWRDQNGLEAENGNCVRRYVGNEVSTNERTGNGNDTQGQLTCLCLMRERDQDGDDTCYGRKIDFTPEDDTCPNALKGGLKDCPAYCLNLVDNLGVEPAERGWKERVCETTSIFAGCGGGGPKIKKFVKNVLCTGAPPD